MLQSIFYFSFACAPNIFMNKETIKTIQTNTILSIHSKDHSWQGQLNFSDVLWKSCVTVWLRDAPERSDLAYYKLCNIIDTVLAHK